MASPSTTRGPTTSKLVADYVNKYGKLGFGDLTNKSTEEWVHRVILFHLMNKLCKHRIAKFKDTVLPLYRALFDLAGDYRPERGADFPLLVIRLRTAPNLETQKLHYIDSWTSLWLAAWHSEEAKKVSNAIAQLAVDFHLVADWFVEATLFNISRWHLLAGAVPEPVWCYPGSVHKTATGMLGSEEPLMYAAVKSLLQTCSAPPAIPVYNPAMETQQEHRAQVQASLKAYYVAQTEVFRSAGFFETTEKRTEDRFQHMRWFVLCHVKGKTAAQLATRPEGSKVGASAITKAVRIVADALPIPYLSATSTPSKKLKRNSLSS